MSDIPMIQPRGPAPAVPPSTFDIPILMDKGLVPGKGPRVEWQLKHERSATFGEDQHAAVDMQMAKGIGRLLHSHYRGHFWDVIVDSRQGYCAITITILLGNWKYKIPLKDLTPQMVIEAGGHILERFTIPRSSIDMAAFVAAREKRVSRASQLPPG